MKANASQAIEFAKLALVSSYIRKDAVRKYDETMSTLRDENAMTAASDWYQDETVENEH